MKSAFIITMHCPLNYGAILQTYALQTHLQALELKVSVINYRPDYIVCDQSLMYIGDKQFKRNFVTKWAYRLFKAIPKIRRRRRFAIFAQNELRLTPTYKTYEDILAAGLDADYFFCGSDQIWNVVSGAHKDPSYFLSFAPAGRKTISYAASGNLPLANEEVKEVTFPMINKLDCVSMREDSTIASIQPFIKKAIVHVCDPVFLLTGGEWRKLYKKYSNFKPCEKYVLVYPMANGGENTMEQARKCANQMNLPLYSISASQRKDNRADKQFDVSPYDFLSLIDHAECVVTNSFHGTSFSIILQRQFWTCVAEGSNQRITSLLGKADLTNRLIVGNNKVDYIELVDLEHALMNLYDYICLSRNFIKNCINE